MWTRTIHECQEKVYKGLDLIWENIDFNIVILAAIKTERKIKTHFYLEGQWFICEIKVANCVHFMYLIHGGSQRKEGNLLCTYAENFLFQNLVK